jgi:dinuclear metal center YbgI/SA1388 family protein
VKRRNSRSSVRDFLTRDLCSAMEEIAPTKFAAPWDNVGLLVGEPTWRIQKVLLTIDLTLDVAQEAVRLGCEAIVSYHPPIFKPIKSMILDHRRQEGIAAIALATRIAIYSPHTALDSAPGGTNDVIAELCSLKNAKSLVTADDPDKKFKLVTFVPPRDLEKVADALYATGAGVIGEYTHCSYQLRGTGTFFGTEGSNPTIGRRGRMESVDEVRLEVVCPSSKIETAIAALRSAHPYEEPAFDVYLLHASARPEWGMGRVGTLASPVRLGVVAHDLQRKINAPNVSLIGDPKSFVDRLLIVVGSAGDLVFPHLRSATQFSKLSPVVITGEIRHHDALAYQRHGACAIALSHWASERPVLQPLAARLKKLLPAVQFVISKKDVDPFQSLPRIKR